MVNCGRPFCTAAPIMEIEALSIIVMEGVPLGIEICESPIIVIEGFPLGMAILAP